MCHQTALLTFQLDALIQRQGGVHLQFHLPPFQFPLLLPLRLSEQRPLLPRLLSLQLTLLLLLQPLLPLLLPPHQPTPLASMAMAKTKML